MIIIENRGKVKRKALSLVNKGNRELSKPEKKFLLEMMMGMVLTGSCNLTEIARRGQLTKRTFLYVKKTEVFKMVDILAFHNFGKME